MIRLLWRTDVHSKDKSPESRTDEWSATVESKLLEIGKIAHEYKCDGVLDGGDFFDDKTPIRTSHRLVSQHARIHETYPCGVWGNVGNHDVKLGQIMYLADSPLESLFASGIFRRLYDEHEAVFEKDGVRVRVVGIPYHGRRYDLDRFRKIQRGDEDWLLCCGHLLASLAGGEMFANEDVLRYGDLPNLAPGVDVFLFGHWHKNQGILQIPGHRKWVVNTGSLTRGSLSADNMDRKPGVVLMEFGPRDIAPKLMFIPITVQPAIEVFDLEKRVREESRSMVVDSFVKAIQRDLQRTSKSSLKEMLLQMNIPDIVRERTLGFIEQANDA